MGVAVDMVAGWSRNSWRHDICMKMVARWLRDSYTRPKKCARVYHGWLIDALVLWENPFWN